MLIFPLLILQTIIIAQITSTGGEVDLHRVTATPKRRHVIFLFERVFVSRRFSSD